ALLEPQLLRGDLLGLPTVQGVHRGDRRAATRGVGRLIVHRRDPELRALHVRGAAGEAGSAPARRVGNFRAAQPHHALRGPYTTDFRSRACTGGPTYDTARAARKSSGTGSPSIGSARRAASVARARISTAATSALFPCATQRAYPMPLGHCLSRT